MHERRPTPKRGPWLARASRGLELAGLLLLIWGLASSRWLAAAAGAATIVAAYALYRRHYPAVSPPERGTLGMGDGD